MTNDTLISIHKRLKEIISGSKWQNHLFSVGGCIRDYIMFNEVKDIDLVVDLPNGGIEFAKWLYENGYTTGEPVTYPTYGTAMFHLKEFPNEELEVVETRKEQYKDKDSRNPEVVFGTLVEDCLRRDLTINAIYYNISTNEYVDYVGGRVDLMNHVIQTPSDPNIVFNDDPLRMMRVIRFACKYGWEISESTLYGIKQNAHRISIITQERITEEMIKSVMCAIHPSDVYDLWSRLGLSHYILSELESDSRITYKNKQTQLEEIKYVNGKIIPEYYFAVLFHNKLDVLDKLKLSNQFIYTVKQICKSLEWIMGCDMNDKDLSIYVRKFGKEFGANTEYCMRLMFTYVNSFCKTKRSKEWMMRFWNIKTTLENEGTMVDENTKLPIDGNDIMEYLHLKPSKKVKELLKKAWNFYFEDVSYTREQLLEKLKEE